MNIYIYIIEILYGTFLLEFNLKQNQFERYIKYKLIDLLITMHIFDLNDGYFHFNCFNFNNSDNKKIL